VKDKLYNIFMYKGFGSPVFDVNVVAISVSSEPVENLVIVIKLSVGCQLLSCTLAVNS